MRKIVFYIVYSISILLVLSSCRTEEPIIDQTMDSEPSLALRIALNNFKDHDSLNRAKDNLCFDFVYPIELAYNSTSHVKVANNASLLEIIAQETKELFIAAIEMPFEVVIFESFTQKIHTEAEFFSLLKDCGVDLPQSEDFFDSCFTLHYPIEVVTNNGVVHPIASSEVFVDFLDENMDVWWFEFVFPLTVTLEDTSVVVLENNFELFDVLDTCFGCGCEHIYEPVCVLEDGIIYHFPNTCEAICAGFSTANFVDCCTNNPDGCSISNLVASPGSCNSDGSNTYALSINFDFENPTSDTFLVGTSDGTTFSYLLSDLPITIPNYIGIGEVVVLILGSNNCSSVTYFTAPNCP